MSNPPNNNPELDTTIPQIGMTIQKVQINQPSRKLNIQWAPVEPANFYADESFEPVQEDPKETQLREDSLQQTLQMEALLAWTRLQDGVPDAMNPNISAEELEDIAREDIRGVMENAVFSMFALQDPTKAEDILLNNLYYTNDKISEWVSRLHNLTQETGQAIVVRAFIVGLQLILEHKGHKAPYRLPYHEFIAIIPHAPVLDLEKQYYDTQNKTASEPYLTLAEWFHHMDSDKIVRNYFPYVQNYWMSNLHPMIDRVNGANDLYEALLLSVYLWG